MFIGYSRISTSDQCQNSLDNQLKYLEIQSKGLNEKFKGYTEVQSGKSFEGRKTLTYILTKLSENDILGVYDNSRLGKNTSENN